MNFKRMFAILPVLALPLFAEMPKFAFEANANAITPNKDFSKLSSNGINGYTLGLAARIATNPDFAFRVHANVMAVRDGRVGTGLESPTPRRLFAGIDLTKDYGKLTVFGGLFAMKWRQEGTLSAAYGGTDPALSAAGSTKLAGKLGGRVGLEYVVMDNVRAVVSYSQTEFNRNTLPGWYSVGVSYRFLNLK